MLGYGCGVSMYPHFFVEDLKTYQMLPRPYMRSFDGATADQVLKKNGCWTWKIEQKRLYWKVFETKTREGKRNSTINMQNW